MTTSHCALVHSWKWCHREASNGGRPQTVRAAQQRRDIARVAQDNWSALTFETPSKARFGALAARPFRARVSAWLPAHPHRTPRDWFECTPARGSPASRACFAQPARIKIDQRAELPSTQRLRLMRRIERDRRRRLIRRRNRISIPLNACTELNGRRPQAQWCPLPARRPAAWSVARLSASLLVPPFRPGPARPSPALPSTEPGQPLRRAPRFTPQAPSESQLPGQPSHRTRGAGIPTLLHRPASLGCTCANPPPPRARLPRPAEHAPSLPSPLLPTPPRPAVGLPGPTG